MISIFKEKLNKAYYVLSAFNLLNIFEQILKMKYNKDYGFDPIPGAQFSDIDYQIIITIVAYYTRNKITNKMIETFIDEILVEIYDTLTQFVSDMELAKNKEIIKYADMFNIKNEMLINAIKYYKIMGKTNINIEQINKNNFIREFLIIIVIPKISYATKFLNCSFFDIMGGTFCKNKCGFSGTVSIKLPECDTLRELDKYYHSKMNFCNTSIEKNEADIGAVYAAILDLTNNNMSNGVAVLPKSEPEKKIIHDIIDNLGSTNCLIDAGGFLVDYTPEEVILEIVKKTKFKYYIYIDIKNTKYVIEKDNKTNTTRKYNYTGITYSSQEVFIYYDWFSYCRTN